MAKKTFSILNTPAIEQLADHKSLQPASTTKFESTAR